MKKIILPLIGCFSFLLTSCGLMGNPFGSGGGNNPFAPKSDPQPGGASEPYSNPYGETSSTRPDVPWSSSSSSSSSSPSSQIDYHDLAARAFDDLYMNLEGVLFGGMPDQYVLPQTINHDGVFFSFSYSISSELNGLAYLNGGYELNLIRDLQPHFFDEAILVGLYARGVEWYSGWLPLTVEPLETTHLSSIFDMASEDSITTYGRVTALHGTSFFLQCEDAAVQVYTTVDQGVSVGENIVVEGKVSIYNGLYEIIPDRIIRVGEYYYVERFDLNPDTEYLLDNARVGSRVFTSNCLHVKSIATINSSSYSYVSVNFGIGSPEGRNVVARFETRYMSSDELSTWVDVLGERNLATNDDKVKPGDVVTIKNGVMGWFNGPQIVHGTADNVDRSAVVTPPQTLYVTFAEAVAAAKQLPYGATSYDFYEFDAYAIRRDSQIIVLSDSPDTPDSVAPTNLFEIYKPSDAIANILTKGAKAHIRTQVRNYNGIPEDAGSPEVTLIEEGGSWYDNPIKVTVSEALAIASALPSNGTTSACYEVRGINQRELTSYDYTGNLTLADSFDPNRTISATKTNTHGYTVYPNDEISVRGTLKYSSAGKASLLYGDVPSEGFEEIQAAAKIAYEESVETLIAPLANGLPGGQVSDDLPFKVSANGYEFEVDYEIIQEAWEWFAVWNYWNFAGTEIDHYQIYANPDYADHSGNWLTIRVRRGQNVCYTTSATIASKSVLGDGTLKIQNTYLEAIDGKPYQTTRVEYSGMTYDQFVGLGWSWDYTHNDNLDDFERGWQGYWPTIEYSPVEEGVALLRTNIESLRLGHFQIRLGACGVYKSFMPSTTVDKTPITIGDSTYRLERIVDYNNDVFLIVDNPVEAAKKIETTSVALVEREGVPYLQISGTYEGYSDEEVYALNRYFDAESHPELNASYGDGGIRYLHGQEKIVSASNGIFLVEVDISHLHDGAFVIHWGWRSTNAIDGGIPGPVNQSITIEGATYSIRLNPNGDYLTDNFWENVGLFIEGSHPVQADELNYQVSAVWLEGWWPQCARIIIELRFQDCTLEQMAAAPWVFELQRNNLINNDGLWDKYTLSLSVISYSESYITLAGNVTDLPKGVYYSHFGIPNEEGIVPDLVSNNGVSRIEYGELYYVLRCNDPDNWNCVSLSIADKSELATEITSAWLEYSGGVMSVNFEISYSNLSFEEASTLGWKLDFQRNANLNTDGSWNRFIMSLTFTDLGGGKMLASAPIGELDLGVYVCHFGIAPNGDAPDVHVAGTNQTIQESDHKAYTLSFADPENWDLLALRITDPSVQQPEQPPIEEPPAEEILDDQHSTQVLSAYLEADKGVAVINFEVAYTGYSYEEVTALNWKLDFQRNANVNNDGSWERYDFDLTFIDLGGGKIRATAFISGLSSGGYICHFGIANNGSTPDIKIAGESQQIEAGDQNFVLNFQDADYWECISLIVTE